MASEQYVMTPAAQRRLDDLKALFEMKCVNAPINTLKYGRVLNWWDSLLDWSVVMEKYNRQKKKGKKEKRLEMYFWDGSPLDEMLKKTTTEVSFKRLPHLETCAATQAMKNVVFHADVGYIVYESLSGSTSHCGARKLHFQRDC